jgi:hypothetical protein
MFKGSSRKRSRRALIPAVVAVLLLALASLAGAQETPTTPQTPVQELQRQTQPQQATPPAAEAKAAEPLYREYRGVTLDMSAADVRAKLGTPAEKSDEMDFFVFSDRERARVYYREGKASTVIATYIGKDAPAPTSASVLGAEVEAKPDGSMYLMTPYPQAGYWVAYSRTPGDSPMVIITMQKLP